MNYPEWVKYKDWAGIIVKGTIPVIPPTSNIHIDRAAYLATTMESPRAGTVQSYDRCAMSGGPFHFTAIQPAGMVQGSLFALLRHLEISSPCPELTDLWNKLKAKNWFVARDGTLRNTVTGALVPAVDIRNEFTPDNGVVPNIGPKRTQAESWAVAFSKLFASPATARGQQEFAITYLLDGVKDLESKFYAPYELLTVRTGVATTPNAAVIPAHTDLAMCTYHAHSVNAPGPAATALTKVLAEFPTLDTRNSVKAAAYLIWLLGTSNYGAWHDTSTGGNRYDNTRINALRSSLWPQELFIINAPNNQCIMPVDLPASRPANTLP